MDNMNNIENKDELMHNPEINRGNLDFAFSPETNLAVLVIKPDAYNKKDEILKKIRNAGIYIVKTVEKKLEDNFVLGSMYKNMPEGIEKETVRHFNSGPSVLILVRGGKDVLDKIIDITGENTDPKKCNEESIRYLFGEHFDRETDDDRKYFRNAIHRAKNDEERVEDLKKLEHLL